MMAPWRKQFLPIVWAVSCLSAVVGMLGSAAPANAAPAEGQEIEAIWKVHVMKFEYHGFSTQYTCGSLHKKLKGILRSVGARDGIQLREYGCNDLSGVIRFEIAFQSPVEATPENIAAASSFDSRDALVARVRGERLPAAEDVQRFPAVWKTVSLARDRELRLAPGDCELVEQLREQILERMSSVQIVSDHVRCSPAFGNIGRPRLTVAALVPANADY
jgi:hypothetical protein